MFDSHIGVVTYLTHVDRRSGLCCIVKDKKEYPSLEKSMHI